MRKLKQKLGITTTISILILLFFTQITGRINPYRELAIPKAAHGPIQLDGNAAVDAFFISNSTSGSSWSDAYILDGQSFIGYTGQNIIEIKNSNRYINITDCIIDNDLGTESDSSIYLENCSHINIANLFADYTLNNGIHIDNCTDIIITDSNLERISLNGIWINNSSNIKISNLLIQYPNSDGVNIKVSSDIHLKNNTVRSGNLNGYSIMDSTWIDLTGCNADWDNDESGIYSINSNYIFIRDSELYDNYWQGILIENSNNTIINNTHAHGNGDRGFRGQNLINITIANSNFSFNDDAGLYFFDCQDFIINNNTISFNYWDGLEIISCNDFEIYNNTFSGNDNGASVTGSDYFHFWNNTYISNDNRGLYIWTWVFGDCTYAVINNELVQDNYCTSDNEAVYILAHNSTFANSTVISNNGKGIHLDDSINVTLYNNIIKDNDNTGFHLFRVEDCEIYNNDIIDNYEGQFDDYGIRLDGSSELNKIYNNFINGSTIGIYLENAANNTIDDNSIEDNYDDGIFLFLSGVEYNNITWNNITSNLDSGIEIGAARYNLIQDNNISNNGGHGVWVMGSYNDIYDNEIGNNGDNGIFVESSASSTIDGNTIFGHNYGINLDSSTDSNILNDNNCSVNYEAGIYIDSSNSNILTNNIMDNCGIRIFAVFSFSLDQNSIDTTNLINGNPCYFYIDSANLKPIDFNNAGQVILLNVNDSIISDVEVSNGWTGITALFCENITISNVIADNNKDNGIYFWDTHESLVFNCDLTNNDNYGLYLDGSDDNDVYNNILSGNGLAEAMELGCTGNTYDNGTWGNYWGDYTINYPSATPIGLIWDTPYEVISSVYDYYPLVLHPNLNVDPIFTSQPGPTSYEVNSTGNTLSWTVLDNTLLTGTYNTYINGTPHLSSTWQNDTAFNVDINGLALGSWNVSIIVADGIGGTADDWVIVDVYNIAPNPDSPPDDTYERFTTGNNITWIIDDESYIIGLTTYTVLQNGSLHASGLWTDDVPFAINIDGFSQGDYNFTIIVDDGFGAIASDEVIITVTFTNTLPSINDLIFSTYEQNVTGNLVTWTIIDPNVVNPNYTVYINGTADSSADGLVWSSGNPFQYSLDGHAVGHYNITIIAVDGYGGSGSDTLLLIVTPNMVPLISNPGQQNYDEGATGNSVNWIATDTSVNSTCNYIVYANGSTHDSGSSWSSGVPININLDGFSEGHHNITILIYDGYGNVNSSEILLIVDPSSNGGGTKDDDDDDDSTEDLGNIPGADFLYILVVSLATFIYIGMKSKKRRKFN